MRQLLWKEWRERRLWLLGWGASIIALTAWSAYPCFFGKWDPGNCWDLPWLMIIAMFIGAGAYSSELAPGRAAFAYSRPVSWTAILLSKLLPALACAGVAVVLGTLLFRWRCPALYLPFISARALMLGAAYIGWVVVGGYLCGLACSVVLAGIAGGILTLTCTVLLFFMAGELTNLLHHDAGGAWFIVGWQCGTLLAAVLLLRFGVTLPTPMRIARYARVCLPVAGCAMLLALLLPEPRLAALFGRQTFSSVNLSPSARYAMAFSYRAFNIPTLLPMFPFSGEHSDKFLLRRQDGATWNTDGLDSAVEYHWFSDTQWLAYDINKNAFRLQRLDAHGVLSSPQLTLGERYYSDNSLLPSPDQRYLLIAQWSRYYELNGMLADQAGNRRLTCVELPTLRRVPLQITNAIDSWWQSAHEIGYDDYQQGRPTRHIIDLNRLPGGGQATKAPSP